MSKNTPVSGIDPQFICTACQRAALEHIKGKPAGLGAVFAWCPKTRRGLFLRSWDGELEVSEVSKPGDREHLENLCVANWERWLATAEIKQAEIEFADHDGPVH